MIKSMTGFGQGRFEDDLLVCTVEAKSINHRFLDFHIKLPAELSSLESKIRRLVQSQIRRGRVDLIVSMEKNPPVGFRLNVSLIRAYLSALEQLRTDFNLLGDLDLVQLLRTPGILNLESLKLSEEALERVEEGIIKAALAALEDLNRMKVEEGKALWTDILKRLDIISGEVARIEDRAQSALPDYRERFESRLNEILKGAPIDPNRLLQEAALYAERSDITEELIRLHSHSEQCRALLDSAEDVGKTLDFILQEMNREANTILSKTTGITGNGLDIANSGISIKTEIEKIREQIQNVE